MTAPTDEQIKEYLQDGYRDSEIKIDKEGRVWRKAWSFVATREQIVKDMREDEE